VIDVWAELFGEVIGGDRVRVLHEADPLLRHHATPVLMATPRDEASLRKLVETACVERIPLVPVGGNTQPRLPADTAQDAVLVSMLGLSGIVEHQVEDLVVTVRAGTTLAHAQEALGAHGQQLPLSAPFPDRATLGGIIATASEGPTLHRFGPVRDQVLGIRIVHGDGRLTKAGGRVVKNVTGYDLLRLYTGARGTLGIITELTLRLRPIEENRRTLALRFRDLGEAWEAGWRMRKSVHGIFALHVVGGAAQSPLGSTKPGEAVLVVSLRGNPVLIESVATECLECSQAHHEVIDDASTLEPTLQTPFPLEFGRAQIAAPPADGQSVLRQVCALAAGDSGLVYDVNTGRLHVGQAESKDLSDALWDWNPDRVDVVSDPRFYLRRRTQPAFADSATARITRELMTALDPQGILNPDRFEVAR
jgi:FAD/FMN-containing dehydrogenase